jgi:hypothetical protein
MKNRVLLIKILGIVLLIVGLFSLFAIPAEFTSFYAFSEGGANQYEGFGFGSLMFAFIIFNTMVYFSLALLCIPVGIGNFQLKKWGYDLSLASLKTLLINGIAITVSILLSFNLLNIISICQLITILILSFAFLIILPYYLIKFYKNTKTKQIFNISNPKSLFEEQSSSKLTIILFNLFWILIFYLFIFFKGAFPLFGKFILMEKGTYLLSVAIFTLLILTYLFYNDKKYATLGMLVYNILLFFTFVITFLKNSTNDFLNLLNLPVYEIENVLPAFAIPAEINLGLYFGILVFIHMYLIIRTKTKK